MTCAHFLFVGLMAASAARGNASVTANAMQALLDLEEIGRDPIATSIIESIKLRGFPMGFVPTRLGELVPAREEFGEGMVGPTRVTKEIYAEWKQKLLQRLFAGHPKEYWQFVDFGKRDPWIGEGS